jgi:hypothetical protein
MAEKLVLMDRPYLAIDYNERNGIRQNKTMCVSRGMVRKICAIKLGELDFHSRCRLLDFSHQLSQRLFIIS